MLNLSMLKAFTLPTRAFTFARLLLLAFYVVLLLHSHAFSLPYIDHPDEPSFYLAGQVWIGAFDMGGHMRGYPPAYIALELVVSQLLRLLGFPQISQTINVMRWIAVAVSAGTLWLIFSAAREAAGDWASLVAGVAWITSPFVVSHSVLATVDPFVYFTVAAALWLSIVAVRQNRYVYAILAAFVSGIALLLKFIVAPLVLSLLVILLIWIRDRRSGVQLFVNQLDVLVATLFILVGISGIAFPLYDANTLSVSEVDQLDGLSRAFYTLTDANRVSNNISFIALPINTNSTALWAVGGLVAWVLASRKRIDWRPILFCIVVILIVLWSQSFMSLISLQRIRDILPATIALCVLLGIAAAQIWRALPNKRVFGWLYGAAVVAWLIFAILPNLNATLALVYERGSPDRRVEVRQWADATLEDGWIAVPHDYEKVFNPSWGGTPSGRWFDYLVYQGEFTEKPLSYWRDERGMLHAIVSLETAQRPENQEYFAQLLPLKTFANPPYKRGSEVIVYRTIPIQTPLDATFGDQVKLIGMDFEASDETLRIRLYWQPLRPLQSNYSLYLHLYPLDSRQILAQQDGAPKASRPTVTWDDTGEILVSDWFTLSLPEACDVRLTAGLYEPFTGVRFTLPDGSDFAELWRKPCP